MKSIYRAVAASLAALLLLTTAAPANAERDPSLVLADMQYAELTCEWNEAVDRFYDRAFPGREKSLTVAEVKQRLPQLRWYARAYAKAAKRFAEALAHPTYPWPAAATMPIWKLKRALYGVWAGFRSAARAKTAVGWLDGFDFGVTRKVVPAAEKIDEVLNKDGYYCW